MAQPNAAAMALDAADGKIDGKFFGSDIQQQGNVATAKITRPVGQPQISVSRQLVPYTGAVATGNTAIVGGANFGAANFGAANFGAANFVGGANLLTTGYAPSFNTAQFASPFVGAYGGRALSAVGTTAMPVTNVVGTVNTLPATAINTVPVSTGFVAPTTTYGYGYGNVVNSGLVGGSVINTGSVPVYGGLTGGTVVNSGLVGTTGYTGLVGNGYVGNTGLVSNVVGNTGLYGANYLGGIGGTVVNRVNTAPVVGLGYNTVNTVPVFGGTTAVLGANNAASKLALDAADGVIDGNFFGSRIV